MLKRIDSAVWGPGELTGGGAFVTAQDGTLVVVTPVRSPIAPSDKQTFAVLRSTDNGDTWVASASYEFPHYTSISEPQVAYNATEGSVYILMTVDADGELSNLNLFKYNIASHTLYAPVTLITAQRFKPSYSLCFDPVANEIVVVAMAIEPQGPAVAVGKTAVLEIVLNYLLMVERTTILFDVGQFDRETYSALQVINTSSGVELYCLRRPRVYSGTSSVCHLVFLSRAHGDTVWDTPEDIQEYKAEFNDDKLTVIPSGTKRYLVNAWWNKAVYVQDQKLRARLEYGLQLGYKDGTEPWAWQSLTSSSNFADPTLSISNTGSMFLAYLQKDANSTADGLLQIVSWDPVSQVVQAVDRGIRNSPLTYLRGSLTPQSATSGWAFVGVKADGSPYFISALNLPPTISYTLSTQDPLRRRQPLLIDASGTFDPDNDDLQYEWSTSSSNVTLIPNGPRATVTVLPAWGPSAGSFNVTLKVRDLGPDALPLHSDVTATIPVQVALNKPPSINWYESPIYVERGSTVLLEPVITDPDDSELTFAWHQNAGTNVMPNSNSGRTLLVDVSSASVYGETLIFTLEVSDGVNPLVSSTVQVVVPAIKTTPRTIDGNGLSVSHWKVK
jgi:hypothetical protein